MSTISVKVDENMGRSHIEFLQQTGYSAEGVLDKG